MSVATPAVELNANGRLYAEAGAGVIGDYQRSAQIVFVGGNQVAVGHGQSVTQTMSGDFSREEVVELLDQAESALETETTLTDTDRQDALADVAAMRARVANANPNRQALTALATGLASVASLTDIADRLHRLSSSVVNDLGCCPVCFPLRRVRWHQTQQDPPSPAGSVMGRAGIEPATLGLRVPCSTS